MLEFGLVTTTVVCKILTPCEVPHQMRPLVDKEFLRNQVHFSTLAPPLPNPGSDQLRGLKLPIILQDVFVPSANMVLV